MSGSLQLNKVTLLGYSDSTKRFELIGSLRFTEFKDLWFTQIQNVYVSGFPGILRIKELQDSWFSQIPNDSSYADPKTIRIEVSFKIQGRKHSNDGSFINFKNTSGMSN